MSSFQIDGMNELLQRLERIGNVANQVEDTALNNGGKIIQRAASERVIRSDLNHDHLADNIKVSSVKTKNGVKYVEIGPSKGDNSKFFYGKFVEWGTSKMIARPFLGPAVVENKTHVINEMKNVIKEALR